ncbi:MAG: hypothetical protein LC130_26090 [Bryobacterales bacterium]|nr:hypothetical protein [Bryobacterales bacterium]
MSELTNRAIAKLLDYLDTQAGGYATRITRHGEIVPDYLGDMDEALTLPLEPDMYYLLEVPGEDSGARCAIWNQHPRSTNRGRLREVEVAADTPAAAVCAAWWRWMEAK